MALYIICAHDFGRVKEQQDFWWHLRKIEPFSPKTALLVDDTVSILRSAQQYGIACLLAISTPDSTEPPRSPNGFSAIDNFFELLPVQPYTIANGS
ncbi:MAG: hypothetical protein CSA09_03590 [Candidatus Contendobacter odensis]|uniref:HAD family hydrolase n=1 Tax=Candidatus Contendibacter odensensis TaxID=1400860 RepID=A0A2G6PF32_9GAMM|nr:MAG: hypothetical protein CSA09_03590 [Candidatus Contendobacter odensis]